MRRVVIASAFGTMLGACTYIYGLDDFEGEGTGTDAGAPESGSSDVASSDAPASTDGNVAIDGAVDAGPLLDCNNGILAHWQMDEGSGTAIGDRCSKKLDGVTIGTVSWGKRGSSNAVMLDGDGYVTFGETDALRLTGPFTIAGFIRSEGAPSTGYAALFWNFSDNLGVEITLSYENRLYASVGCGAGKGAFLNFPDLGKGVWTHVAAVFEPNVRLEIFTNGQSVEKTTNICAPMVSASETRFGAVFDSKWTGGIDDLIVFSRALSQPEIAALAAR